MEQQAGGTPAPPVIPASPASAVATRDGLDRWFSIWFAPRATIRGILDTDPRRGVLSLVIAGGLVEALGLPFTPRVTEMIPLPVVLQTAIAAALVPAIGVACLYLLGFLLSLTGRWLEGRGDAVAVRAALAWAYVPRIWSGLLLLPLYTLLAGGVYPRTDEVSGSLLAALLVGAIGLLEFVVGLWQLVILLKGVAEAHRFSAWRALGALALAFLLLVAPLALVAVTASLVG